MPRNRATDLLGRHDGVAGLARTGPAELRQTPGVGAARRLDDNEMRGLLAPWFGTDLPVDGGYQSMGNLHRYAAVVLIGLFSALLLVDVRETLMP